MTGDSSEQQTSRIFFFVSKLVELSMMLRADTGLSVKWARRRVSSQARCLGPPPDGKWPSGYAFQQPGPNPTKDGGHCEETGEDTAPCSLLCSLPALPAPQLHKPGRAAKSAFIPPQQLSPRTPPRLQVSRAAGRV